MQTNIVRFSNESPESRLDRVLGEKYRAYRDKWGSVNMDSLLSCPLHIDFELVDRCNQSCVMCPRNQEAHPLIEYSINTGVYQDFDAYKRVIDDCVMHGLVSINLGAFAEPLIHPRFVDFILYAKQRGIIDIRVITNGLLLSRFSKDIIECGVTNLYVSIDAFSDDVYKKVRGHGYSKVIQSVLEFMSLRDGIGNDGLPVVRVSFVDMPVNRFQKDDFVSYWRDRVDFVDVQLYDNYNIIHESVSREIKKKWDCLAPWARLSVLANGDVIPCCNFNGRNIVLGNVMSSSIIDLWLGEMIGDVRNGIKTDSSIICNACQRE